MFRVAVVLMLSLAGWAGHTQLAEMKPGPYTARLSSPLADASGSAAQPTQVSFRAASGDVGARWPIWADAGPRPSASADRAQFAQLKPGPETGRLDFLVGTWVLTAERLIQAQRHQVQTATTYQWAPGRRWLQGAVQVTGFGPGVHHGWSQLTYDDGGAEYLLVWTDSQSARLSIWHGSWREPAALVLHNVDESSGRQVHRRQVFRMLSSDRIEWELSDSDDGSSYARRAFGYHIRANSERDSNQPQG